MSFTEIKAEELKDNPFDLIGKQWMLITAGNEEKCNTMTASWGGVGIMWGKPTADFEGEGKVVRKGKKNFRKVIAK